jgi:hypothetical protein
MRATGSSRRDERSLGGRFVRPVPLHEGEEVLEEFVANYAQSTFRAVGGKLVVTTERVVFTPHHLDAATAGRTVSLPLEDIVEVGVQERGADVLAGGIRRRLRLRTQEGAAELFVVPNRRHVIDVIERARDRAARSNIDATRGSVSAQDPAREVNDDGNDCRAEESGQEAQPERQDEQHA